MISSVSWDALVLEISRCRKSYFLNLNYWALITGVVVPQQFPGTRTCGYIEKCG